MTTPSAMAATTRIFEDASNAGRDPSSGKIHKRTPSVGEFLRGRKNKENDRSNIRPRSPSGGAPERPLGERPINSPPQLRRVPLKDEPTRPAMHIKAKSSMSFRSLIKEKERPADEGLASSRYATDNRDREPKKSKSSTNLVGLLKKRSNKNLGDKAGKGQENVLPPASAPIEVTRKPIWAEFSTQSLEAQQVRSHQAVEEGKTVWNEPGRGSPKPVAENRFSQQSFWNRAPSPAEKPPRPPFLQQRPSDGSLFKEELGTRNSANGGPQLSQIPGAIQTGSQLGRPPVGRAALPGANEKRSSRIQAAIETLNSKSRPQNAVGPKTPVEESAPMSENEINSALESLLDARNIAPNMRNQMRALDKSMKLKLIQNQRGGSSSSTCSMSSSAASEADAKGNGNSRPRTSEEEGSRDSKRSRSRPRSRGFTLTRRDGGTSPVKKQKADESTRSGSKSRPKSADLSGARPTSSRSLHSATSISNLFSSKPDAAAVPGDFIHYMREVQKPELVEIGKMHKLRILLRNESIEWTDRFVRSGGMDEVVRLLYRIIEVEWREEHEDTLLHETLLCLKGLCTTSLALQRLAEIEAELFPKLLKMLFDEERKGPSEFSTRSIVISLLFAHLSAALEAGDPSRLASRARTILAYLQDPSPDENKKPFDFIEQMHLNRPYRVWAKEVVNVTKEVFWIFLHHLNVIPITSAAAAATASSSEPLNSKDEASKSFTALHFPPRRAPHPAAPYVGGVEWEATTYLATHLDLLNGIIASLPSRDQRNQLRADMRNSGWEKVMGATMRTCKEKFYAGVHEGLKVWVAAAIRDGWAVDEVRIGPGAGAAAGRNGGQKGGAHPAGASPVKKMIKVELPPRIQLDVGLVGRGDGAGLENGWI